MQTPQIILLDFDGTLADTTRVILQTMQATIRELHLPPRSDKDCAAMIGLRLSEIPSVLYPECKDVGDKYAVTYRRLFHDYNKDGAVTLYPGVLSTLETLAQRGILLSIVSSRSHASLQEYIERYGLTAIIPYILGADDVIDGKPHPEPVLKTLSVYGLRPDEALVVGDTAYDIQMGKNAGTRTCGVTYGNGSVESLANADFTIDCFSELLRFC